MVTSGEGGLFPAGIPIGTIESFDDSDPDNHKATMRPYVSISDIKDVFIMVPNTEEDTDVSDSLQSSVPPASVVPPESTESAETTKPAETTETGVESTPPSSGESAA